MDSASPIGDLIYSRKDANLFAFEYLPSSWTDQKRLLDIASKYRQFRLQSLQLAPEAFASTYEQEILFGQEVWLQRLENGNAKHIMAVQQNGDNIHAPRVEAENEWVGMIVIIEKEDSETVSASTSPWSYNLSQKKDDRSDGEDGSCHNYHYLVNGLFVHPSSRRTGLGTKLIQEALAYVKILAVQRGLQSGLVSILVDTWNKAAIALYSSCGFQVIEESEYTVGDSARKALTMSRMVSTSS